jgi:hypothetical protein
MNGHTATRGGLVWKLPILLAFITVVLWLWSAAQYRAFLGLALWTDYTPIPLEVAGALNAPVATFTSPLYELVQPDTTHLRLALLLIAVVVQWMYVGGVLDRQRSHLTHLENRFVTAIGVGFGLFVLSISFFMHHVALIYRAGAFIWCLLICWHFGRSWRGRARSGSTHL